VSNAVKRPFTTGWEKPDLQPLDGANPDHVAVDETVTEPNDERFWLYAVVDPDTNSLLHLKLAPTRKQVITEVFLGELREKHLVDDAGFLVDSAPSLHAALHRHGLDYDTKNTVIETASNVSYEN
jgi:putative transposase